MRLYFGHLCRLLHDREQKAYQGAEQYARHDLQRRVADHFLQVHILQKGAFFSLTSIHWAIIWFSTFACSPVSCRTPMASCMVMIATTQATAKSARKPRRCVR